MHALFCHAKMLRALERHAFKRRTYIGRRQEKLREFYYSSSVQYFVAGCIAANFFVETFSLQVSRARALSLSCHTKHTRSLSCDIKRYSLH